MASQDVSPIITPVAFRDELIVSVEYMPASGRCEIKTAAKRVLFLRPDGSPLPNPVEMPLNPHDALMIALDAAKSLKDTHLSVLAQAQQQQAPMDLKLIIAGGRA